MKVTQSTTIWESTQKTYREVVSETWNSNGKISRIFKSIIALAIGYFQAKRETKVLNCVVVASHKQDAKLIKAYGATTTDLFENEGLEKAKPVAIDEWVKHHSEIIHRLTDRSLSSQVAAWNSKIAQLKTTIVAQYRNAPVQTMQLEREIKDRILPTLLEVSAAEVANNLSLDLDELGSLIHTFSPDDTPYPIFQEAFVQHLKNDAQIKGKINAVVEEYVSFRDTLLSKENLERETAKYTDKAHSKIESIVENIEQKQREYTDHLNKVLYPSKSSHLEATQLFKNSVLYALENVNISESHKDQIERLRDGSMELLRDAQTIHLQAVDVKNRLENELSDLGSNLQEEVGSLQDPTTISTLAHFDILTQLDAFNRRVSQSLVTWPPSPNPAPFKDVIDPKYFDLKVRVISNYPTIFTGEQLAQARLALTL